MGLLLLLSCLASAADWHTTQTPHFEVYHQAAFMPPGFMVSLEKIHSRLRMDLSMFSPWMAKEKIKLYLYKDRQSYLQGQFAPPKWSDGLAIFQLKAVAVPDRADRKELAGTIAHEITHLLFESYWQERKMEAPVWLDEGLAMLEEDDPRQPSGRLLALAYSEPGEIIEMERFFSITPAKDLKSDASAQRWYNQAYGMTRFLYRSHSKLQFKAFCGHIRDGKSAQQALWLTYRYATLKKFEDAYLKWLRDPKRKAEAESSRAHFARAAANSEEEKPQKKFEPKAIKPMQGFRSLQE